MSAVGYLVSPIFDRDVTDDLVEQCRSDARQAAERQGATLLESPPVVTHLTYPSAPEGVRCLRFEMTR